MCRTKGKYVYQPNDRNPSDAPTQPARCLVNRIADYKRVKLKLSNKPTPTSMNHVCLKMAEVTKYDPVTFDTIKLLFTTNNGNTTRRQNRVCNNSTLYIVWCSNAFNLLTFHQNV